MKNKALCPDDVESALKHPLIGDRLAYTRNNKQNDPSLKENKNEKNIIIFYIFHLGN
jgi:hypothetical protein